MRSAAAAPNYWPVQIGAQFGSIAVGFGDFINGYRAVRCVCKAKEVTIVFLLFCSSFFEYFSNFNMFITCMKSMTALLATYLMLSYYVYHVTMFTPIAR